MNAQPETTAAVYVVSSDDDGTQTLTTSATAVGYGCRRYPDCGELIAAVPSGSLGCVVLPASRANQTKNAIAELKQHFISLPIVILLDGISADEAVAFMQFNVHSVVVRPHTEQKVLEAIDRAVHASARGQGAYDSSRDAATRMAKATPKEIEVLNLIIAGHKNKEIAQVLGLTVRAVEDRRFRLMKKVGVESAAELVALAVSSQYFDTGMTATEQASTRAMEKLPCLKGMEIWEPDTDGNYLCLQQSCYRDAQAFQDASAGIRFRRGEGLPGRIWEHQTPMFMRELIKTEFLRTHAADEVGMTTALGFPVFRGEELSAVVLLLLDTRHDVKTAFESWRVDPQSEELRLIGGTFVNCDGLRRLSEFVHLPLGQGIAGVAASSSRPYVSCHPAGDQNAVRGVAIEAQQLSTAIGIPLTDSGATVPDVFLCLNNTAQPVFRFIQIWEMHAGRPKLVEEVQDGVKALNAQVSRVTCGADSIVIQCQNERQPILHSDAAEHIVPQTSGLFDLNMVIAIPTFVKGGIVCIVVLGT